MTHLFKYNTFGLIFITEDTNTIIYHYWNLDFDKIIEKYFENIENILILNKVPLLCEEKTTKVIDSFLKLEIEKGL
uniref:Uncharacterized protein n=1 Tax=viral metagenome TaxID=1070528 RepID=A0A6C0H4T2_9ZZZZ